MCLVGDTLYVADTENHAIRAVDLKAKTVTTVAGNGKQAQPYGTTRVERDDASLNSPWDVVQIPGTRALLIAMAGPHQIWRFDLDTGTRRRLGRHRARRTSSDGAADGRGLRPAERPGDRRHAPVRRRLRGLGRPLDHPRARRSGHTLVGTHDRRGQGLFDFGDVDGKGDDGPAPALPGRGLRRRQALHRRHLQQQDQGLRPDDPLGRDPRRRRTKPGDSDNPPLFYQPGGLSVGGRQLYVADTNNHGSASSTSKTKAVRTLRSTSSPAPTGRPSSPTFANATVIDAPRPRGRRPASRSRWRRRSRSRRASS